MVAESVSVDSKVDVIVSGVVVARVTVCEIPLLFEVTMVDDVDELVPGVIVDELVDDVEVPCVVVDEPVDVDVTEVAAVVELDELEVVGLDVT
jgi:hypothetical protein